MVPRAMRNPPKRMRLNKIIALSGIASRRKADNLISSGAVMVNGRVERKLGSKAVWGKDHITVEGRPVPDPPKKIYLMLNKPFGYVSTLHDPEGRPIILDLIPDASERVYPVGRLDFDSQGLMILTNDGELAYRLMHPRYRVPRTYKAKVVGTVSDDSVSTLKKGVDLRDGRTNPARVRILKRERERSVLRVIITEGRYREIRRMFAAVGHDTISLARTGYGPLALGRLKVGKYRLLSGAEIDELRSVVGLSNYPRSNKDRG